METRNIDWQFKGGKVREELTKALKGDGRGKQDGRVQVKKADGDYMERKFDTVCIDPKYYDDEMWSYPYGYVVWRLNMTFYDFRLNFYFGCLVEEGSSWSSLNSDICDYKIEITDTRPYKNCNKFRLADKYIDKVLDILGNSYKKGATYYYTQDREGSMIHDIVNVIIEPIYQIIKEVSGYKDVMAQQKQTRQYVVSQTPVVKHRAGSLTKEQQRAFRAEMRKMARAINL